MTESTPRPLLRAAGAAAALCAMGSAEAVVFTVGAGAGCTTPSLQAAIDAARDTPGPDEIRVASNQTYSAQALRIGQQDLIIEGGYADCAAATPTGSTVISGEGGSLAPVFTITGSGVRDLRRLGIIRGDASPLDGEGGGISFAGSGELRLTNVAINQNRAAFGGGINFRATASPAALTIGTNTTVSLNTAQFSGGGIRIEGVPARLYMLEPQSAVFSNTALGINPVNNQPSGGFGGGIQLLDGARADIASGGFGAVAAVQDNEAVRGGGIALTANSDAVVYVRLFPRDAANPPSIRGNRASATGGGFYVAEVDGSDEFGSLASVCLFGARLEDNVAANGAAVYLELYDRLIGRDRGGVLQVRRPPSSTFSFLQCGDDSVQSLGSVPCAPGTACNLIRGNRVEGPGGAAADGAVLSFQRESFARLEDAAIIGNSGTNLLRSFSEFESLVYETPDQFVNCLVAGNTTTGALLRYSNTGRPDLRDCTIAGNTIGGTHVVQADDARGGSLARSIIWQPGKPILSYPGGGANSGITIDKVLVSERTTLPDGPNYLNGEARFNDPATGDWRLRISSAAVDGALPVVDDDRDLAGDPRDQIVFPPPRELVRDAGAFERQQNAPLLVNGAFAGSLSPWVVRSSPHVTLDAANNDGMDGSGAALISWPIDALPAPPAQAEVVAQCFNVPFPGTYRLTARAAAPGFNTTRDVPKMIWRRRTASADCTGAAVEQGETFFPGSGASFADATPVDITVPVAGFGAGASIEVVMAVAQNATGAGSLVARFDNARLIVVAGQSLADPLFANGFEPQ